VFAATERAYWSYEETKNKKKKKKKTKQNKKRRSLSKFLLCRHTIALRYLTARNNEIVTFPTV
jgi:hypothetical protein